MHSINMKGKFFFLSMTQASSKNEFGKLHISHMYNQDKKVLSVEILMGENLPALDRNGLYCVI